jgi:mannitol operon repressor
MLPDRKDLAQNSACKVSCVATQKHKPDAHDLFMSYLRELQKETPRGAVIISGVVLAEQLGKTLEHYLTDHKEVKKLLDGGVSAPLGSFSARILMAFGLRLIDEKEYRNLQIIRKIRNHFAHNLHASFDDQEVKSWCDSLDSSALLARATDTPNKKFNAVSTMLAVLLANKALSKDMTVVRNQKKKVN